MFRGILLQHSYFQGKDMSQVGNATIWLNVFKRAGENQPDYRGKVNIGGQAYAVSLWVNTEKGGTVIHMSGQISTGEDDEG